MRWVLILALTAVSQSLGAQDSQGTRIVDARINQYCHPPEECVLRGGLIWDTTNVAPRYPEIMRSVGIDGEVLVSFSVRPDGAVADSSIVIIRATNQAFERLTRDAVRSWKFRIESSDRPTTAIPTVMGVVFALADGCPDGMVRPITSLMTRGPETRLIVLVCRAELIPRN